MQSLLLLAELKALGVCLSTRQELSHHPVRDCPDRAALDRERTRGCVRCATGHCTCCGIVLLWPGRDRRQPLLRGRDLAYDTMTP